MRPPLGTVASSKFPASRVAAMPEAEVGQPVSPPAGPTVQVPSPARRPAPFAALGAAAGIGAPVALYLWVVARYSLDVIVSDQWDDVTVIRRTWHHLFNLSALWTQHNENRMLFPNLIVVLLAHTTHFDIVVEEWLSASLLLAAVGTLVWAVRRRCPCRSPLVLCPLVLLSLSVVQFQNTLWGFQMAWYLIVLCLVVALVLLDRERLGWPVLAAAAATAVIGSFSSLQGLLIWPAGLVVLLQRRAPRRLMIAWLGAMGVSAVIYFHGYRPTRGSPHSHYVLHHPVAGIEFFFALLGDVVGSQTTFRSTHVDWPVVLFGVVIAAVAVVVGTRAILCRRPPGVRPQAAPLGTALICYGILFAGAVTIGRAYFHYWGATQSRYTTFDLLIPIGTVICLLEPGLFAGSLRWPPFVARRWTSSGARSATRTGGRGWPRWAGMAVIATVAAVVVLQLGFGTANGLAGARSTHSYQLHSIHVVRHVASEPAGVTVFYLYPFRTAQFIRRQAATARALHLAMFAGSG